MNARPNPHMLPPPPAETPGPERLRNSIIAMGIIFSLTFVLSLIQKEPTSRWFEGIPSSEMVLPLGDDPAQPLVIALHDQGESMADAGEQWKPRCQEQGCALLVLQGSRPHEQGFAFNDSPEDIAAAWALVDRAVSDMAARGKTAPGSHPLVLVGLGQGADIAWAMTARLPDRVRGLLLVNRSQGTASKSGLWKARDQVRIALLTGQREPTILEKAQRAHDTLAADGVPVALYVHPEGRRMPATPEGHSQMSAALRFVLGKEQAPAGMAGASAPQETAAPRAPATPGEQADPKPAAAPDAPPSKNAPTKAAESSSR